MNTGMPPSTPHQLSRADDRVSFLYLEHCTLGRDGGALTATDDQGVIHVPVAALSVLLLGPGTRLTHQAVSVVADSGCSLVWVGEEGVRYYAHGRSIARSTRLLELQAEKVSNSRSRIAVAREMYAMRFPGEDTSKLTMQQLRGKEGARVRKIYRECSRKYRVDWSKREYDPDDFNDADPINRALSAAHTCLYGLAHAVITSLGCSPGLGFTPGMIVALFMTSPIFTKQRALFRSLSRLLVSCKNKVSPKWQTLGVSPDEPFETDSKRKGSPKK